MKRLFVSAVLFLFWIGAGSFVFAHTSLKGTWVLKNIEEVPKELHYTCPNKIAFDEEESSCTLYYDNDIKKQAGYYQMPGETSIYFSISGTGSVPEKQFFLECIQKDNTSMQLKYVVQGENVSKKEYVYHYQLQN